MSQHPSHKKVVDWAVWLYSRTSRRFQCSGRRSSTPKAERYNSARGSRADAARSSARGLGVRQAWRLVCWGEPRVGLEVSLGYIGLGLGVSLGVSLALG